MRNGSISNLTVPPSGPRIPVGEIDRQGRVGAAVGVVEQLVEIVLGDADRQNAVLEAVVVENIAERGRDHAADAEIEQRPGRVFAARPQPKFRPRPENPGVAVGGLVEDEIRVLAAVVLVALFGEQSLAEPGALDGLEILLRDDHVGIDIDDLQRRCDAFQRGELVHRSYFSVGFDRRIYGNSVVYRECWQALKAKCAGRGWRMEDEQKVVVSPFGRVFFTRTGGHPASSAGQAFARKRFIRRPPRSPPCRPVRTGRNDGRSR